MPHRVLQVLPHGVMLAFAGFLYWAATRIDVSAATGSRLGADTWPKAVIVVMALLCAYEIVKRLLVRTTFEAQGLTGALTRNPAGEPVAEEPQGPEHRGKLVAGTLLVVGYVVAVPWLGFFVATALFLAAFPLAGGLRRGVLAAAIGLAGSLVLIVLFMRVAYISLPLGEGPFRALTLALLRLIGVT